jgi:hypothetical protein
MGIPGLTSRLINRGHWITMEQQPSGMELDQAATRMDQHDEQQQENREQESQQQSQQEQQQQQNLRKIAIIDGPSLAYHISAEYRYDNSSNRNAEYRPSYKDIGARAVQFVEDLEAVGLQM